MTHVTKKISASWSIELYTECPHCNEDIDLMNVDDIGEKLQGCGVQPLEYRFNVLTNG